MSKYTSKKPDAKGHIDYTDVENSTWTSLYARQINTIQTRACDEFIEGLSRLNLSTDRIPQLSEVNTALSQSGDWQVKAVDAIIPLRTFFDMLAHKQFPVATFIRTPEEIDYLQEPDLFHELFGHCPLLTDPTYTAFMQEIGHLAASLQGHQLHLLSRLFWFTIEFGLIQTQQGMRIMGAGILSSHAETIFSLESDEPLRLPFSIGETINTEYRYDQIQKKYFILNDWHQLYELTQSNTLLQYILTQPPATGPDNDFINC